MISVIIPEDLCDVSSVSRKTLILSSTPCPLSKDCITDSELRDWLIENNIPLYLDRVYSAGGYTHQIFIDFMANDTDNALYFKLRWM